MNNFKFRAPRQIEISNDGFLSEVNGENIGCPIQSVRENVVCNKNCAWFSISKYHAWFTLEKKDFEKNMVCCGNKTIGQLEEE